MQKTKDIKKIRLAVLIGKGGRIPAIYSCVKRVPNCDLVAVISHKKKSPGLSYVKKRKIESFYFRLSDWKKHGKTREEYDLELAKILKKRKINLVIMAGWDLIVSAGFLNQFPNKVMNIHPSLLPSFPGTDSEKQALDYGVKYIGCTLHFVDPGIDTGAIIFQRIIEIKENETIKSLQKKVHMKEEEIICKGIKLFSQGRLKIKGRKVSIL